MFKYVRKYPLTLLLTAVILFLSLFNPPRTKLDNVTYIDKIAHICMYGGLELVIWIEYLRQHNVLDRIRIIFLGIMAPIVLGGLMELAQMYLTAKRSGEWADFAADTIGVLSGAAVGYFLFTRWFHKKR